MLQGHTYTCACPELLHLQGPTVQAKAKSNIKEKNMEEKEPAYCIYLMCIPSLFQEVQLVTFLFQEGKCGNQNGFPIGKYSN